MARNLAALLIGIILVWLFIVRFGVKSNNTKLQNTDKMSVSSSEEKILPPPYQALDLTKTYSAVLKTSEGDITILLDTKNTPKTVNNFVYLSKKEFYNNTIFHRVIKDFMIQGGDPKGNGTGGPGYQFDDEPVVGEYSRGVVAMANAGPNTNGSQFFIMHKNVELPKNYVIFGSVMVGLETVDKIAQGAVEANSSGELSKPINSVVIKTIEITEK